MTGRFRRQLAVAGLFAACLGAAPALAQDATPEVQAVDALQAVFGKHPGIRANHAKGVVVTGSFSATPEAATLSKAVLFSGAAVPLTARFSDSTGVPQMPDGDPNANPHGMALKFHLPDGSDTDVVVNSLHFFPVRTVAEFRDLLLAIKATAPNAPKPTPVDQFFAAHTQAGPAFASATTPVSFGTETYYGIDAFILVDKAGGRHPFRYRFDPEAGAQHLDAAAAAKLPPDGLMTEIVQRIGAGPMKFKVMAQLAEAGDNLIDPTIPWPDSRKLVELGTLTLDKAATDSDAQSKTLLFMPTQLTDGIEASDDPLIASRAAAYAESFGRRSQ